MNYQSNLNENTFVNREAEKNLFFSELFTRITNASRIYLFTHKFPDLDSICSNLALAILSSRLNPDCEIVIGSSHSWPERAERLGLPKLLQNFNFVSIQGGLENRTFQDGLVLAVDFNELSRIADFDLNQIHEQFQISNTWCLDHHTASNKPVVNRFISEEEPSATALVYDFWAYCQADLTADEFKIVFDLIFIGLLSDTNDLRRTVVGVEKIQTLIEVYKNLIGERKLESLFNKYQESEPREELYFKQLFVQNQRIYKTVAYTSISLDEREIVANTIKRRNYKESVNGADEILNLEGTFIGFCVDEQGLGKFRISFRPCNDFDIDVSLLAKEFGGGGHKYMAGATVSCDENLDNLCLEIAEKCHNWLCRNHQL